MADKLIFLDIDGVLNAHGFSQIAQSCSILTPCVSRLNKILLATRANIVLSSAWRYMIHGGSMTTTGFDYLLSTHGVAHGRIIGITREDADTEEPRWRQIADWLRSPPCEIHRYCIIDDDPDAFGGRPGVLTNGGVGLTEADADEAIKILGAAGN